MSGVAMAKLDVDEFEHRPAWRRNGMYLPALFIMGVATAILGFLLAIELLLVNGGMSAAHAHCCAAHAGRPRHGG